MAEITYLEHILKSYDDVPKEIKKLAKKLFAIKKEDELKNFAKSVGVEVDGLEFDKMKEKIAYELIERYFATKNHKSI